MAEQFVKKFQRGDTVQLKSGGPVMTVEEYEIWHDVMSGLLNRDAQPSHETEIVSCTWFDKNQRRFGKFHQDLPSKYICLNKFFNQTINCFRSSTLFPKVITFQKLFLDCIEMLEVYKLNRDLSKCPQKHKLL